MITVLSVIGTRPEAIKLAPVLHRLESRPDRFRSVVLTTGQHHEMLKPMLELFDIRPTYDLHLSRDGNRLSDVTSGVLLGLGPILNQEEPDWLLVQGDTTTTMAASLAAFYAKIRLAHVEAGLRTFDKFAPYPEEINRRIAGLLADLHFAPTDWARANLLREGVPGKHVHVTGNTVIDAMRHVQSLAFDPAATPLRDLPEDKRLVLFTAHRNENLAVMPDIVAAVRTLALSRDDLHFVYPVHLNPQARGPAWEQLSAVDNVSLFDPLGYQETVWLLDRVDAVVTDSGGLQEEAAGMGVPALVLRETTERPEGIDAGIARLVAPRREEIVGQVSRLLDDHEAYERMLATTSPYGDGRAAERIVELLAGKPTRLRTVDPIYERPTPGHPLDELLREATAGLPRRYADQVLTRAQASSSRSRIIAGTRG